MGRQRAANDAASKRNQGSPPAPTDSRRNWSDLDNNLLGKHQPIAASKDTLTISTAPGHRRTGSVTITANRRCRLRLRVVGEDFAIVSPSPTAGIELQPGDEYVATVLFSARATGTVEGSLELVSTAAAGPTLTMDSRTRVTLRGRVVETRPTRKHTQREPEHESPRLTQRDETAGPQPIEQRDGYSPKETPRIEAFTYSILSAETRTPAGLATPLSRVLYIRDRVRLRILASGASGPLALDRDTAQGLSIIEQSESLLGEIRMTLRAEVPGSYKLRFRRKRSHYRGKALDVVVLPESKRPRSSVLGRSQPTGDKSEEPRLTPANPSQLRCDNEINPDDTSCYLTSEQRSWLRTRAAERINSAADRFSDAVAVVKDEISDKLSVERAFWRALFELAFGFGVGRIAALVGSGIVQVSDIVKNKLGDKAAETLGKSDLVKGPLAVLTKHAVRVGVNGHSPSPKALFARIRQLAQQARQDATDMVGSFTDNQLIAAGELWALKNCTEADYVLAIRTILARWRNQVDRIGKSQTTANRSLGKARPVWIKDGRLRRLALAVHVKADRVRDADIEKDAYGNSRATNQGEVIRRRPGSIGNREVSRQPEDRWYFETWIDPDMQDLAIARGGGFTSIQVLDASSFSNRADFDVD